MPPLVRPLLLADQIIKGSSRIYNMKIGTLFYFNDYTDNKVYKLLDYNYDYTDPDWIEYTVEIWKTKEYLHYKIIGDNVRDTPYLLYKRRDKSSFVAGFRAAMSYFYDYMSPIDKSKAGLDNDYSIYSTMYNEYEKWKRNFIKY